MVTEERTFPPASADWDELARLFAEAFELEPEARARFLEERCAGRPGLRWELDAMVASAGEDAALELESLVLLHDEAAVPAGGRGRSRSVWAARLVVTVAVVGLAAVAALQLRRVTRERDRATLEAREADAVVGLLVGLVGATDPNTGAVGDTISVSELLRRGEARAAALDDQPDLQARLRRALGNAYLQRSQFDQALVLLGSARATELERLGAGDARTVPGRLDFARALYLTGHAEEARVELGEALDCLLAERNHDPALEGRARIQLGALLHGDESEQQVERGIEVQRTLAHPDPLELGEALTVLAMLRRSRGDWQSARTLFEEALELEQPVLGVDHPSVLALRSDLAAFLPDPKARVAEHRKILDVRRRLFGERSPLVAGSWGQLGLALAESGEREGAATAFRESYSIWNERAGPSGEQTLTTLRNLARMLDLGGHDAEAAYAFERLAYDLESAQVDPLTKAAYRTDVAAFDLRRGRLDAAARGASAALQALASSGRSAAGTEAKARAVLAGVDLARGEAAAAIEPLRSALDALGTGHSDLQLERDELEALLGRALIAVGRPEEGLELLERALPRLVSSPLAHPVDVAAAAAAVATARAGAAPAGEAGESAATGDAGEAAPSGDAG